MEVVKQIINSKLLDGVIPLPKNFQNKKVEIIVFLQEEKTILPERRKFFTDTADSIINENMEALQELYKC